MMAAVNAVIKAMLIQREKSFPSVMSCPLSLFYKDEFFLHPSYGVGDLLYEQLAT